jgi:hypothetical protein
MKEKTTEQSAVRISRNTPHCTVFQLSSNVCMNLRMDRLNKYLYATCIETLVWLVVIVILPYYLLVVPYAVVQSSLHLTEQFSRAVSLFLFFLLVCLITTVLF